MKIGAIGIRTKIIVGDAATWYLVKKYIDGKIIDLATDYETLNNKPKINDVELSGNKTSEDLGLVSAVEGKSLVDDLEIEKLAGIEENANNYTHPEKHSSSILDVVDVVDGAANKFLNERGEMVAVAHEGLTDKNSEAAVQHIDTTTTKPTLDAADMVALYDSVTGKMVLSDVLTKEYVTKVQESLYSYGVEFDQNQSTTTLYRIGNQELHRTLPVQSGMRRCLVLDDGTVNYYTHPTNTLMKEDGVTPSVLDGTDGQLMVEVPEHWRKFTTITEERFQVRLSMVEISGYHKVEKFYVSALEASVHRPTNKLSSVINLSPDYRGGNNNAAWDGAANTLLGRPASSISLTNFRTYARNRGAKWNVLPYEQYKSIWYLYMVEYANTNVQLPFSAPDPTGLKTGGLGNGVTDANSTEWNNFSGYNPFIPCGASIMPGIGNLSGEKTYTVTNFGGAGVNRTFKVPSYRGIENIFGHIWKHTDGVLVEVKTDADGGTSKLYTQSNPAMFADVITNYTYRGNLARTGGYIKKLLFGNNGDILPTQVGGGSTTYYAEYFETNTTSSQTRCVLLSAHAIYGASAGLSYAYTLYVPANASASLGARLCYIV